MKSNYNGMPDTETLERYWGSTEAYLEEQRRTAIYNFDTEQLAAEQNDNRNYIILSDEAQTDTTKHSLHLPTFFRHHHAA